MNQVNPTPWHVSACSCGDAECVEYEAEFCSVFDADDVALDMSDAQTLKLIAAAPEMLELLIDVADFINHAHYELDWSEPHDFLVKCQKVIKKAKGES